MLDLDKLGLKLTKPKPPLFHIEVKVYWRAVDWLRRYVLSEFDRNIRTAEQDPYTERWSFHDEGGAVVMTLPHDLIDRIDNALRLGATAGVYARQAPRDSPALGAGDIIIPVAGADNDDGD